MSGKSSAIIIFSQKLSQIVISSANKTLTTTSMKEKMKENREVFRARIVT